MPQIERNGSDRHPLEATAIGYLQHGRLKHNMFSVLWSDRNEILIYRTFEDFKKLNRDLRKKFPLESGLFRKSENVMPKLKDVPIFRRNRQTNRFIERLRLLGNYCTELLKSDQKISQCEVVRTFFTPKNDDLNPTFPENSSVIMPSELRKPKAEIPKLNPEPPASGPLFSQQYVCIEDYESKDTKNRPFAVKRNEQVGVLVKESSGWWLVENEEKRVAWFPAPYLKNPEKDEDANSATDSDYDGILYYASKGYEAMSADELTIVIGVLVEVVEKSNNGWWLVRYNGRTGFVPAMYLKPYSTYQQLQTMISHGNLTAPSTLFKASSTLALNTTMEDWRSKDDYAVQASVGKGRTDAMKLNRKKSRSLYGLPSNMQSELAASLTQFGDLKAKPMKRSNLMNIKPTTSNVEQEDCNYASSNQEATGVINKELHTTTKEVPASGLQASPPQVPQRPKTHEILHKCTTVTKKALQTSS
uniref:NADPH oxidase organizer 1 n=1 Tax=Leptobrachium leishanense TaxID=445787 RepID=A0A8C5QCH9_9ANUR